MTNADEVLSAVLSLKEATELGFRTFDVRFDRLETRVGSLETRMGALETLVDRSMVKILERFDTIEVRLIGVERR
jgi:hypothetical protein